MESNIDIDLIKDEQNPMYQNIDIQRQRLLSVLNKALEKICIAYVLEDMLTKCLSVLQTTITQPDLEMILKNYRNARCLEDGPGSIKSTVMRRSSLFKSGRYSAKSFITNTSKSNKPRATNGPSFSGSNSIAMSASLQLEVDKIQEQDKGSSPYSQLIRSYYNSVIAKLHSIPEVTDLAQMMINKKPVGTIKYYIYLKDLRDHIIQILYETKTDEMNRKKGIKLAYVKNLKEKPQAEAIKKVLTEKQNEKNALVKKIREDIKKEKLIQNEMNEQLRDDSTALILNSEDKIIGRTHQHHEIQEENKVLFAERTASYNKKLDENLASVLVLRKRVKKFEVCLRKILDDYDSTIGALHGEFEIINDGYLRIDALYKDLKLKFDIQEEQYEELMAEKEHFIEMTCLRIRYNKAAKIIQHWWRAILYKRWKWRKTYLAAQLKRRSLAPEQRSKMKKVLKKINAKQLEMQKKFASKNN